MSQLNHPEFVIKVSFSYSKIATVLSKINPYFHYNITCPRQGFVWDLFINTGQGTGAPALYKTQL